MQDELLANEIVQRLNELIKDPKVLEAIEFLIKVHIQVFDREQIIVNHPTIQCLHQEPVTSFGFLGMLNGLVGGQGYIGAMYDNDRLTHFKKLI